MLNSATTSVLRRRSRGSLLRAAVPAIAAALLFPAPALAVTTSQTFSQPGEAAFTVPQGVNQIHVDAFGAPGGGTGTFGGAGAEVQGDVAVTPGQTLYLEVGIGGGTANYFGGEAGGDGGGESDVRTCSLNVQTCSVPGYGPATSWQTQLLVAAGGGGGAAPAQDPEFPGAGGDAGLLNAPGGDGHAGTDANGGQGATASNPGRGGSSRVGGPSGTDGGIGALGPNTGGDASGDAGAGGAGRYGGGAGGGVSLPPQGAGGGGGGSSWVNQDFSGVDQYLTHITGASSASSMAPPHIVLTYSPTQAAGPTVIIQSPGVGQQVGARPTISGTGGGKAGDQPTVAASIYGGQTATGSPVQTLTTTLDASLHYSLVPKSPLASGTYTVAVSQQDSAGDTGSSYVTFVVNAAPPALTITQPADGSITNDPTITFAGARGTEPKDNPTATVTVYAGPNQSSPVVVTFGAGASAGTWGADRALILPDGVYYVVVSQTDNGADTATAASRFTVDTVAPTLSVSTPANGAAYHVGDHVAGAYGCSDRGSGIATCTGPVPRGSAVDTTTAGTHTFTVIATDSAGNTASATVRYTVVPASQPPAPAPTQPPAPAPTQPPAPGATQPPAPAPTQPPAQGSTPGSAPGQPPAPRSGPGHPVARARAGLGLLAVHLRALPGVCSRHPRPRPQSSRACEPAVVVVGVIDARATGQSLTLTWTDGRGEVVRRTVKVGTGGHWATTFGLPPAARTHLGSVRVSYAGTSKLLPATVSRTVARQRRRGAG